MTSFSLIVLAYKDAEALPGLVMEWTAVLSAAGIPWEIILVNDGSPDDTGLVCDRLAQETVNIRAVHHPENRGVGAGMATGIRNAKLEWIGYTDGDAQYTADDFSVFRAQTPKSDVISGLRVNRADPKIRSVISSFYNFLIRHLFQVQFRDVNSGLKFYHRRVIGSIGVPESAGPFFDAEMMVKSVRHGFNITELPIRHRPRVYGKPQGASLTSILKTIRSVYSPVAKPLLKPDPAGRVLLFLLRGFIR
ncbi:MAG: glycosyltransferase family 2 protein [Bacteroidetes bacterium]|nr:glycosyltransferase family 2 protein [Bacteroidota bacterium]